MAVTSIWKVDNHLSRVVEYAGNAEKTENPKWLQHDVQALADVMDYAMNDFKTEKQFYVTCLNCETATARDEMQATKLQFGKTDGILAFHGYQSFAPDEADAETAHKIGVELAERLWPDYQVVVGTHLNTKCFHNHFVINSVSFIHGKKFDNCPATYTQMRRISDDLCCKYRLSVITDPKRRGKHYAEWKAENEGRPTWRSAIREDVDQAVRCSMSFQAFIRSLKEKGYEVVTGGKYMKVRPEGKERFVRLYTLGDNYTEDAIKRRILRQRMPVRPPNPKPPTVRRMKVRGDFKLSRITWKGLRALYFHYLYKLRGAQRQPTGQAPFLLREDLRLMDAITEQAKFLHRHGIDNATQLANLRADTERQIAAFTTERKALSNEKRRVSVPEERSAQLGAQINTLSAQLKSLRRDVRLCDAILERSLIIREKIEQMGKSKKEEKAHEPDRRRGGTDREHGDNNGTERR
jgi:hypothetical protein